ncbi:DNA recombination protein RmuC [Chitinophaga sp. CF118]|uniref:DNA recombination protein RmuC n=1 Tax=Chitinophaga sp. CF118 TaxID=1884367 RepID=UPI0008DF57AF|nr:DNA recombination protein RmuC [Chitinophaga sp. CF118]SFD60637.1 DNA recombination protein RmuC [Chitinophaga sp. CF118]
MGTIILVSLLAFIVGFILAFLVMRQKTAENASLKIQADHMQQIITGQKQQLEQIKEELRIAVNIQQQISGEKIQLEAQLRYKNEKLDHQKEEIENIGHKFENQFKVLANQILEEKKNAFSKDQESSLKAILDPLKENITSFKQEFSAKLKTESDDRISLREQVVHMMTLNQTLAEQANNLTQAFRGSVKHQGNWGEMILESILEYTGMQKDIHYFVQKRSLNDDGDTIQPDVLVKYPDSRTIVIDSKVSLVHYENFYKSTDPVMQEQQLALLVRSIKTHIDGLSGKSYQDVTDSLDFVMMFIPVEAAYITAMQTDPALWQYAYKKRIILISPTNIITAMKLVNDMWQKDSIDRNAKAIAERAGKLYDKLASFVEEFDKVGIHLDRAAGAFQDSKKKMTTGKGNLVSQAHHMKHMKISAKKALPQVIVEEALLEDEEEVED